MPDPRGRQTGDLLVRAFVEVPKKLTEQQEELLRQLAEVEQTHVSPHRKGFLEKIKDYFLSSSETPDSTQE